jgi:hypothetical protein
VCERDLSAVVSPIAGAAKQSRTEPGKIYGNAFCFANWLEGFS